MLTCDNCGGELNPYMGALATVINCDYCNTPHQLESKIAQYLDVTGNQFHLWLRQTMIDCFSMDELRFVCDDVYALTRSMNFEDIAGETKSRKVLEMILYAHRRRLVPLLVECGMRHNRDFALQVDYYKG
jgi:hypothetical protein